MEFQKNQIVTVTIEDIGETGEGIGRINGYTLFVKDAVIGDVVEAKLVKVKKNFAFARLERVLTPSSFRVEPPCPFHRQCGGCQVQALSYEEQLRFKQKKVQNHLVRIGGFPAELIEERMEPIVGMETGLGYRNKAQFPIGTDKDGNLIAGFYAGRTHTIISNTDCLLGSKVNKPILEEILAFMKEQNISAYDEETGRGLVRHVLIRVGKATGEVMVCLVINGKKMKAEELLVKRLLGVELNFSTECAAGKTKNNIDNDAIHNSIECMRREMACVRYRIAHISVCINMENTNVIMGNEVRMLYGTPYIRDYIKDLEFHISPLSFYQVNPVQTEKLYETALEFAGLNGSETVWDLYCGIGTISLFLARAAKQVCGVEIIPQAIEDARDNAERNHITNAEFFVGKAEEVLPRFYEEGNVLYTKPERHAKFEESDGQQADADSVAQSDAMLHPDVIVVDPPRKGCDEALLATMLKMAPDRIVYVSCDSATLARDLKYLCGDGGYEVKRIRAVDMFGMTVHVETVVLMSRK